MFGRSRLPRSACGNGDGRYSVEADLTQARIDRLLPGWTKPAGRQARMSFIMTSRPQFMRLDDLSIEGPGLQVKGSVECDGQLACGAVARPAELCHRHGDYAVERTR